MSETDQRFKKALSAIADDYDCNCVVGTAKVGNHLCQTCIAMGALMGLEISESQGCALVFDVLENNPSLLEAFKARASTT